MPNRTFHGSKSSVLKPQAAAHTTTIAQPAPDVLQVQIMHMQQLLSFTQTTRCSDAAARLWVKLNSLQTEPH
jgi:hypothetical protein